MDEFNRPIRLKDIYEVGEDDSILIVKRLTKQNVEDEIGIEKMSSNIKSKSCTWEWKIKEKWNLVCCYCSKEIVLSCKEEEKLKGSVWFCSDYYLFKHSNKQTKNFGNFIFEGYRNITKTNITDRN